MRRMTVNSSLDSLTLLIYFHQIRCESELFCLHSAEREKDTCKFRPDRPALKLGTGWRKFTSNLPIQSGEWCLLNLLNRILVTITEVRMKS